MMSQVKLEITIDATKRLSTPTKDLFIMFSDSTLVKFELCSVKSALFGRVLVTTDISKKEKDVAELKNYCKQKGELIEVDKNYSAWEKEDRIIELPAEDFQIAFIAENWLAIIQAQLLSALPNKSTTEAFIPDAPYRAAR